MTAVVNVCCWCLMTARRADVIWVVNDGFTSESNLAVTVVALWKHLVVGAVRLMCCLWSSDCLLGVGVVVYRCAVEGILFCWGRGRNGRLGTGGTDSVSSPQLVQLPDERQVRRATEQHCRA